jgi:DNA-binding MarR family transcriptional regulator
VNDDTGDTNSGERHLGRYRLLYLLKRGYVAGRQNLEDLVRVEGLATGDYTALSFLKVMEPCSTADLARAQRISPQAATQQVSQLKAKGLAVSAVNIDNRRVSLVTMTDEGHSRFDRIDRAARALERDIMNTLDPSEQVAAIAMLRRLVAATEDLLPAP